MQNANNLIIALSALISFLGSMVYGETRLFSEHSSVYEGDVDYYLLCYYSDCLKIAEELFAATLFDKAALKYEEILQSLEPKNLKSVSNNHSELYSMAVCRIGQIHYFQNDYALANSYFEKPRASIQTLSPELKKLEMQIAYVQAVSSRRLGLYNVALSALARHAEIADMLGEPTLIEARFEKGLNFYLLGNLNFAKKEFQELHQQMTQNGPAENREIFLLLQLYIGRIGISEGDYDRCDALLAELVRSLNLQSISKGSIDSLQNEIAYLRGEIAYHKGNFLLATELLLQSLPKGRRQSLLNWTPDALGLLGWSYLKLAESADGSLVDRSEMFAYAEKYFNEAIEERGAEEDYLALSQSYLAKSRSLQDPEALKSAEKILKQGGNFKSSEAKIKKLLLRAEIAGNYADKEKLYAQLTAMAPQFADGWLKRGMNDYSHGENSKTPTESTLAFKRAAASLGMAYSLLQAIDQRKSEIALKMFMRAQLHEGSRESLINIITVSEALINGENALFSKMLEQKEIYFLYGQAACRLADAKGSDQYSRIAEKALWSSVLEAKGENHGDESLNLLGTFYLRRDENLKSEEAFLHLIAHYPQSQYAGDALYYCAENAEKLGKDPEQVRKYRQQLYSHYPQSQYAPSAYFHYYPYREYLQGDKDALKHLKNFLEIFPENPLAITAHFLIGLDYKRDRKTIEGRSIRKKNLLKAIESFADVDKLFDSKKHLISEAEMPYYVNIRYRALLERALANQVISGESQGTKQEIYFQYAEELYKQIFREFADSKNPLSSSLTKIEPFPRVYEESLHALIKCYRNANDTKSANKLISEALGKYQDLGTTSGYYLSRIHYEHGKIEMLNKEHALALEAFIRAEESNKGKFLSSDQKLDLWIQQAMCNKSLGQMDKAMLILSKVINDDAVSGQRLKAMYLRAEIYELQGRPELARKQLEATAKKGGDWAHKAKVKLDSEYGY